jgi:hypothetical protein
MTLRPYDRYEADPNVVRQHAYQARSAASGVTRVSGEVEREHRKALSATDGELELQLSYAHERLVGYARPVNRAAIWAGLQLENFADAIERYNTESVNPMSISRLNAEIQNFYVCLPEPAPDHPWEVVTDADRQEHLRLRELDLKGRLDGHFERLRADLDDAAKAVAKALNDGPDADDIVQAWKAGNLPPYAVAAWPELGLEEIPIDGVNPSLLDLAPSEVRDLLTDRDDPPTEQELEWLRLNFPDEMADFARDWALEDRTLPAGESPAGREDVDAPHGWIQGPDGRWYPVGLPYASPSNDGRGWNTDTLPDGAWLTVDHRQGPVYAGDQPPGWLMIMSALAGRQDSKGVGPESVGENQSDYLSFDSTGAILTHGEPPDGRVPWAIPKSIPSDPLSPVPPGSHDPYEAMQTSDRFLRTHAASGLASLAIGVGNGALLNNQIDANNSYHGNLTFQEGTDGQRRVVIQLAQIQREADTGEVIETPLVTNGVIDEDGNFQEKAPIQSEPPG